MYDTDIQVIQFPDDRNIGGPWNIDSLIIQPPGVAASPRKFYLI
jgi:hypothetical protein